MFYLAAALAVLVQQTPASEEPNPDIVVIGKRLDDAEAELARCLARKCPVDQDVAATLKVAEMRFVLGDYKQANDTLRRSLGRNNRHGKAHPLPVASLWRAKSRVDSHLGEYGDYRTGALQTYQTLKKGLPATDPNLLGGLVELGDMQMHLGYWTFAEENYRDAILKAERAGQLRIAAIARYRLANVIAIRSPAGPGSGDEREVAAVLAPLIGSDDPVLARFDFAARLFKARLAEKRGAKGAVDALFKSLPKGVNPPPVLLSSTAVKLPKLGVVNCLDNNDQYNAGQVAVQSCQSPLNLHSSTKVDKQWIDVAFWITPEGGVRDIDIIKKGDGYDGDWADRVTASIASRRYSPSTGEGGGREYYRVERFTLTAGYQMVTGSHLRSRNLNAVIETVDLTPG